MKLDTFICASPLYPLEIERDERLHLQYLEVQRNSHSPGWVDLTVIQNGCAFADSGVAVLRNPFPKNIAYNWLLCDVNAKHDYWLFLPEDCVVSPKGWEEICACMEKQKDCFALSKDPKAIVCRRGTFRNLSSNILMLCDMNSLGKEIACVLLRGELDRRGLHCVTKRWERIASNPTRWGNELYEEINVPDHPHDVNKTRSLPTLHDYGLDGWKAPAESIEAAFMKIVERYFDQQREAADRTKVVISHYGPLITEVPYKGRVQEAWERLTRPS